MKKLLLLSVALLTAAGLEASNAYGRNGAGEQQSPATNTVPMIPLQPRSVAAAKMKKIGSVKAARMRRSVPAEGKLVYANLPGVDTPAVVGKIVYESGTTVPLISLTKSVTVPATGISLIGKNGKQIVNLKPLIGKGGTRKLVGPGGTQQIPATSLIYPNSAGSANAGQVISPSAVTTWVNGTSSNNQVIARPVIVA